MRKSCSRECLVAPSAGRGRRLSGCLAHCENPLGSHPESLATAVRSLPWPESGPATDTTCRKGLEPCGCLLNDPGVLCLQISFQASTSMGIKPCWVSSSETTLPSGFWWPCPSHLDPDDWLTGLHRRERRRDNTEQPDGDHICSPPLFLRILSFNNLTRLDEESLADLSSLSILRLSHNSISHIAEGAFRGLKSLRVL